MKSVRLYILIKLNASLGYMHSGIIFFFHPNKSQLASLFTFFLALATVPVVFRSGHRFAFLYNGAVSTKPAGQGAQAFKVKCTHLIII